MLLISFYRGIVYIGALVRDNEQSFFIEFAIMPQETNVQLNVQLNFADQFNKALSAQQVKDWDQSLTIYNEILNTQKEIQLSPKQQASIYHNMSLVALEKKDYLKAYIWSKKASILDPSNRLISDSFENTSTFFKAPTISYQLSTQDQLKKSVSVFAPEVWYAVFVALVLAMVFAYANSYLIKSRLHSKSETNLPSSPLSSTSWKWVAHFCLILSIFAGFFGFLSYKSYYGPKAIVSAEAAQVQTAPGENKSVIFEATAGLELDVLSEEKDSFFQVRYPGVFTGWISKDHIEILRF